MGVREDKKAAWRDRGRGEKLSARVGVVGLCTIRWFLRPRSQVIIAAIPASYTTRLMTDVDYLISGVSLVLASVTRISVILGALLPYISILLSFACFVAWNGGVVLGKFPLELP